MKSESESHSVLSDYLQPHGLYSPWNSPGQYSGVLAVPLSRESSNPGIEPRSPALQADSLPAELPGKGFQKAQNGLVLKIDITIIWVKVYSRLKLFYVLFSNLQ